MANTPAWLSQLLENQVSERIRLDARTTASTFLGWPRERVFWDVLGGGQADFDAPIGSLTGDDRALLYAKYNQGRHLEELGHAFDQLFTEKGRASQPTVIDLGCGPFTAGLALAAALGPNEPFRYFGIDRSNAMLRLGRELANGARLLSGLHSATAVWFGDDLNSANFGPSRGELTIVVASYLLASSTLNVDQIAADVFGALDRIGPGPAAVLYTNSAASSATAKFAPFSEALVRGGFQLVIHEVERFTETSKAQKDIHYALFFRSAKTSIAIRTSK